MKKLLSYVFLVVATLVFSMASVPAYAEWKLYDDFNSGIIDEDKWARSGGTADITIENGMVKFVHSGPGSGSTWLLPNIDRQKIKGIKATIIFDSCTSDCSPDDECPKDVRGRIGSFIGTEKLNPEYFILTEMCLEPYFENRNTPRLFGQVVRLDYPKGLAWVDTPYWGCFLHENGILPGDVMGVPYTFTMEWTRVGVKYEVEGGGKAQYRWEKTLNIERIRDPNKAFVGIGTRSDSGSGPCTVYFDDVYLKY